LSSNQPEIGFVKADLTRFRTTWTTKPGYYRQAELLPSMDAQEGTATAGSRRSGGRPGQLRRQQLSRLIAVETGDPGTVTADDRWRSDRALQAADRIAAFEKCRGHHRRDDASGQRSAIRRTSPGSVGPRRHAGAALPPAMYFKSMADLKGITPAFKKVSDDLANFAASGRMTAIETSSLCVIVSLRGVAHRELSRALAERGRRGRSCPTKG
jgi:hypothetical protein